MSNIAVRSEMLPSLQMDEAELMDTLRGSLYPGASNASIKLVLSYCKATGLDPMAKSVHIVPMWDQRSKQMIDQVMPGIGKYRTDATRTGQLAGIGEPVFGPEVNYYGTPAPEWCMVTVQRFNPLLGKVCDYVSKERWLENYATAGKDTDAPNKMWRKRPYAQLAKCAEAQALRKGFTDVIGSAPTADEMEGKFIDVDADTGEMTRNQKPTVAMPQAKATVQQHEEPPRDQAVQDVEVKQTYTSTASATTHSNTNLASVGEVNYIKARLAKKDIGVREACENCGLDPRDSLDGLTKDEFIALKDALK